MFRFYLNMRIENLISKKLSTACAGIKVSSFSLNNSTASEKTSKELTNTLDALSSQAKSDIAINQRKIHLYHWLKQRFRSTDEIVNVLKQVDDQDKYIGFLPKCFIKDIPKEQIKEKTHRLQQIFSTFAKEAHSPSMLKDTELTTQIEKLKSELSKEAGGECKVEYIGKGWFGKVFKIEHNGEKFALKIFHSDVLNAMYIGQHGQTKELANAIALNNIAKPSQRANFYCGKITSPNEPDGYMLTEFVEKGPNEKTLDDIEIDAVDIDPRIQEYWYNWKYSRYKIKDENAGNNLQGKVVDFGDIHNNYPNKVQQNIAKELLPLIKKGDVENILKLKEKYADCPDFKEYVEGITRFTKIRAKCPAGFYHDAEYYRKTDIDALRALGVNFSKIENFDYVADKVSERYIKKLRELGLQK